MRAACRRRGEPVRPVLAWLFVIGAGVGLVVVWGKGSRAAEQAEVAEGAQLYQRFCAVCHANDGSGVPGVAPPIDGFRYAAIDLTMRTGRMPLTDEARGVRGRLLDDAERSAVMAYLTDLLDLHEQVLDPPPGDPARGREVYAVNCAQCHGAGGGGGLAGDGVKVPPVVGLDPVTVASATREGPFQMPRFGPDVIPDDEVGDIAAFLDTDVHEPTSPLGVAELSKIEVIAYATLLAAAVVVLSAVVGGARRRPSDGGTDRESATR